MKQQAIEQARKKIEHIQNAINLIEKLPDNEFNFPVKISAGGNGYVHVGIPYSLDALRQYLRAMGQGWKRQGDWIYTQHSDGSVSRHKTYRHSEIKGAYLMLALDTEMEKSTCQVVQTGVREVPILEVMCL